MNIRIPRTGTAAKIVQKYLKAQGLAVTHSQALELIARLHGYTDWQALESDVRFADAPALKPVSSNEYELRPKEHSAWIGVDNISVSITRKDEGVSVALYTKGKEDSVLAGTSLCFQDAVESCKVCGSNLDKEGYCTDETCPHSDWPQEVDREVLTELSTAEVEAKYGVKKRALADGQDPFEVSARIKNEYLQSACSRHDVDFALTQLREQCADIFPNDTAMWEFLMEEAHEDNEHEPNLVVVYGDHLENFSAEEDAQRFAQNNLPDMPERAFREDEDCKELCAVEIHLDEDGRVIVQSMPLTSARGKKIEPSVVDWKRVAETEDISHLAFDRNPERELVHIDRLALGQLENLTNLKNHSSLSKVAAFSYTVADDYGVQIDVPLDKLEGALEYEPGVVTLRDGRTLRLLGAVGDKLKAFSPATDSFIA